MSFAQETNKVNPNYELAEKFTSDKVRELLYDTSINVNWIENTDQFWYRFKNNNGTHFTLVDPVKETKQPVFDNVKLASALSKYLNKPYDPLHNPVSTIKFVKENKAVEFQIDSLKFEYDLSTAAVTFIDTVRTPERQRETWKSFSPDSVYVVFAKNHNLFVMDAEDPDSVEHQLTTEGERWYSFASSDDDTTTKRVRARVQWFENSHKLYVVRQDRRKVNDLWVIDVLSEPRPTLETYKYPMPGEENVPQYELWFFNAEKRTKVKAEADKWIDQAIGGTYIGGGGIFIGKTNDKLYFVRRSRDWKDIELCAADT
ncbi:hypothetical protein AMJ80_10875, partial [bacterium SM23_31]